VGGQGLELRCLDPQAATQDLADDDTCVVEHELAGDAAQEGQAAGDPVEHGLEFLVGEDLHEGHPAGHQAQGEEQTHLLDVADAEQGAAKVDLGHGP